MAKDQSALLAIRMRVSKALRSSLKRYTTSADVWKHLEEDFEPKGILWVVQLRRKLLRTRCSEFDDVEDFLRAMVDTRESLACLDYDLSEEDFSIALLTALPRSWESMVSAVNYATDLKDADEIISRIRQHATIRKLRYEHDKRSRSATAVASPATSGIAPATTPRTKGRMV